MKKLNNKDLLVPTIATVMIIISAINWVKTNSKMSMNIDPPYRMEVSSKSQLEGKEISKFKKDQLVR